MLLIDATSKRQTALADICQQSFPTSKFACALYLGAGKVLRWRVPDTAHTFDHTAAIRVDSGVSEGDNVGVNYDPMIAKIVTHAADRTSALQLLQKALAETQVRDN